MTRLCLRFHNPGICEYNYDLLKINLPLSNMTMATQICLHLCLFPGKLTHRLVSLKCCSTVCLHSLSNFTDFVIRHVQNFLFRLMTDVVKQWLFRRPGQGQVLLYTHFVVANFVLLCSPPPYIILNGYRL